MVRSLLFLLVAAHLSARALACQSGADAASPHAGGLRLI
jgi:hypothetical protein